MPKKYRKCMPKGSQNDAKMDAKITIFHTFLKKAKTHENSRNYCIYNIKHGSGHLKTHEKSMMVLSKIYAGKRHAEMMQNDGKREPEWEPKSIENTKDTGKLACQKR